MKGRSASKIKLTSYDELLGGGEETNDIQQVALEHLHSFENHPFQVNDDEAMTELVESVKEEGILNNDVISICMFAVLENESDALSKEELGKYLSEKIPQYMIPVYCEYLSEIPLTVNGKIDIKVLTSRAIEGMKKSRSRGKSEQKLSETEENIYKVWCELFNTTDISVDEDFFECGGDSILVVKLLTELETRYQYKMSLMDVYSSPTIYKMAECITNQQ